MHYQETPTPMKKEELLLSEYIARDHDHVIAVSPNDNVGKRSARSF